MIRDNHVCLAAATPGPGSYSQEPSIWLSAFLFTHVPPIKILKCLLDAGCDINETTVNRPDVPDGWSCIFMQVLRARHSYSSLEFETLRFTLKQGCDICAKDASGLTVSDHVNAPSTAPVSRYRRDLWYCALQREGIDIGSTIEANSVPEYNIFYNLDHFHALQYLDTWTPTNVSQKVHEALTARDVAYLDTEEATLRLSRMRDQREREQRREEWLKRTRERRRKIERAEGR